MGRIYGIFLILCLTGQAALCIPKPGFSFSAASAIYVHPDLKKDAAVQDALQDLTQAVLKKTGRRILLQTLSNKSVLQQNAVLIDTASWSGDKAETYLLAKQLKNGKNILMVKAGSLRAVCYAIYFITEQFKLGETGIIKGATLTRNPDFKFRMITQPFEVTGFASVATTAKPIIREREFDPMRPFDGAGYAPMDEAKNILRSGMNTLYIGSYTFASTYTGLSDSIFPPNTAGRTWVEARRTKFRELIAAAEKYHLQVCVNSDIFAYPKNVQHKDRYKALDASLNEILTDFPEIDIVIGRFGENYSYFNPYFTGKGPASETELAAVIDSIQAIVVKKYHKIFIPRTWSLGNDAWHADPALYTKITAEIKADTGTIFSVKNTQTDFWRYNKFNPTLGKGTKKQAIEYLAQDGYHFKSSIPNYEVIRMARGSKEIDKGPAGMKAAKAMGIEYTWGWLSADGWCGPYLIREEWLMANIFGYTHLMWDTQESPEALAAKWASLAFNVPLKSKATSTIAGILMASEDMILKACYFNGYSSKHDGWLPALNWERDDVLGGGTKSHKNLDCQFSFGPGTIKELFSNATFAQDCADKKQAHELAKKMLRDYDLIKGALPDQQQAREVRNTLVSAEYLTGVIYHYINGMFSYYNGDKAIAKQHLLEWKTTWKAYNEKVSKLPSAPTPMVNGGMVETSEEVLKELANQ